MLLFLCSDVSSSLRVSSDGLLALFRLLRFKDPLDPLVVLSSSRSGCAFHVSLIVEVLPWIEGCMSLISLETVWLWFNLCILLPLRKGSQMWLSWTDLALYIRSWKLIVKSCVLIIFLGYVYCFILGGLWSNLQSNIMRCGSTQIKFDCGCVLSYPSSFGHSSCMGVFAHLI